MNNSSNLKINKYEGPPSSDSIMLLTLIRRLYFVTGVNSFEEEEILL